MKKKLHKELFKLWVEKALEKWGNVCECCGATAETYHHYVPKSRSLRLKYDVQNAVPLCHRFGNKCHYKIHFSPEPHVKHKLCEIICKKRGEKWVEYIETARKEKVKDTIWWLEEQKDRLNASL